MIYIVKEGDSLSKIARDVLGNIELWPVIAAMNNIINPDLIFPGQSLQLPEVTQEKLQTVSAGASLVGWVISLLILGGLAYGLKSENE